MDKKTRNPPDSDLPPPPSYDESSDQAYNPRYSPRLTEEAPAPSDSSPTSQLYPSAHKQQPQQEQQHFHSGQHSNRSPRHHTIIITSASPSGGLDERTALLNGMVEYERQFPLAALFFIFGWYVAMKKFFPPLWFFGACCCAGSPNRYEDWWGKMNFIMAMATLITSMVYSIIVVSTGHWLFLS
ncbi:hypothetical protein [Absidia glauca]|uniref:Uncharacterized protein n=1 Tax=Absidia glauca TaxID=4829 RepID=A0A168SCU8_ABSGL|nr:hypothetical protein [Absidia glauca]